jgi:hypothetical protein
VDETLARIRADLDVATDAWHAATRSRDELKQMLFEAGKHAAELRRSFDDATAARTAVEGTLGALQAAHAEVKRDLEKARADAGRCRNVTEALEQDLLSTKKAASAQIASLEGRLRTAAADRSALETIYAQALSANDELSRQLDDAARRLAAANATQANASDAQLMAAATLAEHEDARRQAEAALERARAARAEADRGRQNAERDRQVLERRLTEMEGRLQTLPGTLIPTPGVSPGGPPLQIQSPPQFAAPVATRPGAAFAAVYRPPLMPPPYPGLASPSLSETVSEEERLTRLVSHAPTRALIEQIVNERLAEAGALPAKAVSSDASGAKKGGTGKAMTDSHLDMNRNAVAVPRRERAPAAAAAAAGESDDEYTASEFADNPKLGEIGPRPPMFKGDLDELHTWFTQFETWAVTSRLSERDKALMAPQFLSLKVHGELGWDTVDSRPPSYKAIKRALRDHYEDPAAYNAVKLHSLRQRPGQSLQTFAHDIERAARRIAENGGAAVAEAALVDIFVEGMADPTTKANCHHHKSVDRRRIQTNAKPLYGTMKAMLELAQSYQPATAAIPVARDAEDAVADGSSPNAKRKELKKAKTDAKTEGCAVMAAAAMPPPLPTNAYSAADVATIYRVAHEQAYALHAAAAAAAAATPPGGAASPALTGAAAAAAQGGRRTFDRSLVRCDNCGERGHMMRDCVAAYNEEKVKAAKNARAARRQATAGGSTPTTAVAAPASNNKPEN